MFDAISTYIENILSDFRFIAGGSSNTMVMGPYDQPSGGQQESPPLMTSSGTCTPTPTSTTHAIPQGQTTTSQRQQGGPWGMGQAGLVKPKATHPSSSGHHHARQGQQHQGFPYSLRESPDEGIQDDVTTDV